MWPTYGRAPPRADLEGLTGKLIVLEGQDGVGRTTQINKLTKWLEGEGHAVVQVGLSRSHLAGEELEAAKEGHEIRPGALALFYAADFYDQMEHKIIPALRAGCVVLADRYVHSLVARGMLRGQDGAWLRSVYEFALRPTAVFNLDAKPANLAERCLHKFGRLDYWESGMDLGLSHDMYDSFLAYQKRLRAAFKELQNDLPYERINADRAIKTVAKDLRSRIEALL